MQAEVHGGMMICFATALINHKVIFGEKLSMYIDDPDITSKWFPIENYTELCSMVADSYKSPRPILEKTGEELIKVWYNVMGKDLVSNAEEFLRFQTGSSGYYSVVRGPAEEVGTFDLKFLDGSNGKATVVSKTPLNRNIECGLLRGGVQLFPEIQYTQVTRGEDQDVFEIEFH